MFRTQLIALSMLLAAAGAAKADDNHAAKVSLVYEHELPNVPGKSIKGILV